MANFYAVYPAGSGGSSTNASVGNTGAVAPTAATEVGGVGPDGLLHPVSTDNSGVLNVNVLTAPTPTGGATAANQQTEITALQAIQSNTNGVSTAANQTTGNTSLASIDSKTPALGQALAAGSVPVVLTAAQLTTLTPLSTVTVVQPTGTNLHTVVDNTVAISAASLPLPTGAATSALQTSGNTTLTAISGQLPTSLGAKTSAASLSVVLASDQATVPVSAASLPLPAGAATAANQTSVIGSAAGGTAAASSILTGGIYNTTLPTLTNGQQSAIQLDSSGRVIMSPSGASSSVNISQYGGTATTLGAKVSASSIPVVLASDQASINSVQVGSSGVANAPVYNVYSSTNITTAAYTQLIASTTSAANYIDIFDSSGQGMILATGASGSEVILYYVPPGGDQIRVAIPAGTRIAYKALTANATSGYLLVNLLK